MYFVGTDVARVLGYRNPNDAIKRHVDKDDLAKRYPISDSLGRIQKVNIINESGFYCLVLASKLPSAKKFKRWVTHEVIPTIRKTGSYTMPSKPQQIEEHTTATVNTKKLVIKAENVNVENLNVTSPVERSGHLVHPSIPKTNYRKGEYHMNTDIKEQLKPHLLEYINEITEKSKGHNQYICPICHSGEGSNHTGAFTTYPQSNSYYCFACHQSGDIFNLYAHMNNLNVVNDFHEIVKQLANKYNVAYSETKRTEDISAPKDYTKLFYVARTHLHETDYLTKRGLSVATQQAFGCGYLSKFKYGRDENTFTPAVIIPTFNNFFMWRSTVENLCS